MKYGLLRVLTFLADVPGWLIVLVVRLLWGNRLELDRGVLIVHLDPQSWPARTWYASWAGTALGHAIIVNVGGRFAAAVLYHERVHVEQHEAVAVLGLVIGAALAAFGALWAGLVLAVGLSPALVLAAMVTAWLRGEEPYRGSVLEEAAYDAQELRAPKEVDSL